MCNVNEAKEMVRFPLGNMLTTIKNFLERRRRELISALHFKNGWSGAFSVVLQTRRPINIDLVAQLVEHNTFNVGALGSSPSGITSYNKNSLQFNQLQGFFIPGVNIG